MFEILEIAYSHANVIITILFGITITYWFTVIIGAMDLGFLDFDLDPDFESDVNVETDFDSNAEAEASGTDPSGATKLMWFFNIGKVPFMVFFTAWVFPTWFLTIICSYYLSINTWLIGLPVLFGLLFICLFFAKILTQPLVKIFQRMEMVETKNEDLIGKLCIAKYGVTNERSSHVIVQHDGSEYTLDAKTAQNKKIERNAQGLIIDYNLAENTYTVEPIDNL